MGLGANRVRTMGQKDMEAVSGRMGKRDREDIPPGALAVAPSRIAMRFGVEWGRQGFPSRGCGTVFCGVSLTGRERAVLPADSEGD